MFMYLQKNKKGFTLIELMVVVAIIGILALLGLRLYTTQQQRAKDAIVKANAGTVQTLLQSELADKPMWTTSAEAAAVITGLTPANANMQNPYTGNVVAPITAVTTAEPNFGTTGNLGEVLIQVVAPSGGVAYVAIQGVGGDGALTGSLLKVYK